MKLTKVAYCENRDQDSEWKLEEWEVFDFNLIVGRNATGKSRVINILSNFAKIITKQFVINDGHFTFHFENEKDKYFYEIEIIKASVRVEILKKNDQVLISRNDKKQEIYSEVDKKLKLVSIPENEILLMRREKLEHSFLEDFYTWAINSFHMTFGDNKDKDTLGLFVKGTKEIERIQMHTIGTAKRGLDKFPDKFKQNVINDINKVGFEIVDFTIAPPVGISIEPNQNIEGELLALSIKEKGVKNMISQHFISQGMFRALALVIQVNYAYLSKEPSSIFVDDVGEGLDFDRSCQLIKLILEKTKGTKTQVFLSTNDRFVMNSVDLSYWQIAKRKDHIVKLYNHVNSKKSFDDFKLAGLNNFDFFSMDFLDQ